MWLVVQQHAPVHTEHAALLCALHGRGMCWGCMWWGSAASATSAVRLCPAYGNTNPCNPSAHHAPKRHGSSMEGAVVSQMWLPAAVARRSTTTSTTAAMPCVLREIVSKSVPVPSPSLLGSIVMCNYQLYPSLGIGNRVVQHTCRPLTPLIHSPCLLHIPCTGISHASARHLFLGCSASRIQLLLACFTMPPLPFHGSGVVVQMH